MEIQQAFTKADCLPNGQLLSVAILKITGLPPGAPQFLPNVIFWVYERHPDFFGSQKKQRDFLGYEKRTKGLFWVC